MLEKFLQGRWLKHPLHPAIVHIPVSMWVSSFTFDLLSLTGIGSTILPRLSMYAIAFGLLIALAAIPTGLADWWGIGKDKPAWKLGVFHMAFNWVASLFFTLSVGLRLAYPVTTRVATIPLLLSTIGILFLFVGVYLGGRMTYEYGSSVARNSKEKWRERAVQGGARVPAK